MIHCSSWVANARNSRHRSSQRLREFLYLLRKLVRQVDRFAAVLAEVVEFPLLLFVVRHQFPVSHANRSIVFVQPPETVVSDAVIG